MRFIVRAGDRVSRANTQTSHFVFFFSFILSFFEWERATTQTPQITADVANRPYLASWGRRRGRKGDDEGQNSTSGFYQSETDVESAAAAASKPRPACSQSLNNNIWRCPGQPCWGLESVSQVNTDRSQLDHELFIALLTRRKGEWGFPSAKKSPLGPCGASFVCRWLGVATSEHKQFALTHKDTFSHSHLTKQPTGNRTDTSLSALRSEIAAPAVIKPGSHFLPFSAVWIPRKGFWVKTQAPPPHPLHAPPASPTSSAGSRKSALPLPPRREWMQKWCWLRGQKGRSQFSIWGSSSCASSLLSPVNPVCCLP